MEAVVETEGHVGASLGGDDHARVRGPIVPDPEDGILDEDVFRFQVGRGTVDVQVPIDDRVPGEFVEISSDFRAVGDEDAVGVHVPIDVEGVQVGWEIGHDPNPTGRHKGIRSGELDGVRDCVPVVTHVLEGDVRDGTTVPGDHALEHRVRLECAYARRVGGAVGEECAYVRLVIGGSDLQRHDVGLGIGKAKGVAECVGL